MKNAKKTEQLKKLVDLVCDISMLFEVTAEKTPEEKNKNANRPVFTF